MILTVTANPAVDVIYELGAEVVSDGLNRARGSQVHAGGKGINVSRAIAGAAGSRTDSVLRTAALLGGHTGKLFAAKLKEEGISVSGISTACETRINVCAVSPDGEACEINGPGGPVSDSELAALTEFIESTVHSGDIVILAGSLPRCVENRGASYWAELIPGLKKRGCTVILDCSGDGLNLAVNGPCPPDMIKPNLDELCELLAIRPGAFQGFHEEEADTEEILFRRAENASEKIAERGISVLATLGSHGAVFTPAGEPTCHIRQKSYPVSHVANVKGAGDTFLGVFTYNRFLLQKEVKESLDAASRAAAAHVSGKTSAKL